MTLLSNAEFLWLTDRREEVREANPFLPFLIDLRERELWAEHGGAIVDAWIVDHPSTRPSLWWSFSAPRAATFPGRYRNRNNAADLFVEPRRVLSGAGRPAYEVVGGVPRFHLGVPVRWVDTDASKPLVFETQRDYLKRHGLLMPRERPATVEPEVTIEAVYR